MDSSGRHGHGGNGGTKPSGARRRRSRLVAMCYGQSGSLASQDLETYGYFELRCMGMYTSVYMGLKRELRPALVRIEDTSPRDGPTTRACDLG